MTRSRDPSESWSELECDTDFLGTTGRREVQLAHKQEMAGATAQWGFLCIPSPTHKLLTSHLLTSPVSDLSKSPKFSSCSLRRHLPQQPFHLSSYSSLHILISSLRTHLILTLSQKLEWKQEVINQWSVPSGRKTNCWAVSCFSWTPSSCDNRTHSNILCVHTDVRKYLVAKYVCVQFFLVVMNAL